MVVNINPCASTYDETLQALKFSAIATQVKRCFCVFLWIKHASIHLHEFNCLIIIQLVHGPCSKTRVAYILSLLNEQQAHHNDTTLLEEEEEESDEEGDITMFDPEVYTVYLGA